MIKYADDIVIGGPFKTSVQQSSFSRQALSSIAWCEQNGLLLNRDKCLEVSFSSRPSIYSSTIPDSSCFTSKQSIKYLGVIFTSNLSWSQHVEYIFSKCLRLTHFIRRLRILHVNSNILHLIISSCALPALLYCSPVILPGLKKTDFRILRKSLKILSFSSGISFDSLCSTFVIRHFNSCSKLCTNILKDPTHPLYPQLNRVISSPLTRSSYRLLPAKSAFYRNSVLPYLSRFLCDPNTAREELLKALS